MVFRRQNHKTVIFIEMMSHDLLVQMAYPVRILSVYNLMIGYSKKNRENYARRCFSTKEKETGWKFNSRLAMIGHQTTAPCMSKPGYFNEFLE